MKKLIFALLASIVLYSCTGIFGSGVPMEETRGISHMYEGICVESAIRVYLSDEIEPNTIHIRADEMMSGSSLPGPGQKRTTAPLKSSPMAMVAITDVISG